MRMIVMNGDTIETKRISIMNHPLKIADDEN